RGTYRAKFHVYQEVPPDAAQKVAEVRKKELEEAKAKRGRNGPMKTTLLCVLIAALGAACLQRADRAPPASDTSAVPTSTATPAAPAPAAAPTLPPSPGATKVTVVEGFLTPESVLHDPVQDIYFVSNINGSPTAKDNNGFISRVRPDGAV